MKRIITIAIVLSAMRAEAQTPRDVPEVAAHEIARRGNHVEMTGTVRSGLITAALAPPEDDSAKWFITLIVKPGDVPSDIMKSTIATDPEVRHWIDAVDPSKSTAHYQVRLIDDKTQRDWLVNLRPAIDKYGLPCVVVQPPRNGQFGDPATIVKTIHGQLSGKQLAEKLREGVMTYIRTIETPRKGVTQDVIGVPPPFNVPPASPSGPSSPVVPFEWPPAPAALTVAQIQSACPKASPEFVMSVLNSKDTSLEIVNLKYQIWQKDHPSETTIPEIVPSNPPYSPSPRSGSGMESSLLVLIPMMAILICLSVTWQGVKMRRLVERLGDRDTSDRETETRRSPRYHERQERPQQYQTEPINEQTERVTWRPPVSSGTGSTMSGSD